MEKNKKQTVIYLALVLGSCYILGFLAQFTQNDRGNPVFQILQKGFTAFPVTAALLTRYITKDKTKWRLSLKVWKHPKLWVFSSFVPGVLTAVGAALYFILFPGHYSGVLKLEKLIGMEFNVHIDNPLYFGIVCILTAAACIPVQLLELGEEIGWREYLLPKQIERHGLKKGILLNGFYWGIAHLPLIYYGFNYSPDNTGAPWSNMAMMMLVCMTIGTISSYVMVRSNNVMYPAIIHGVINIIGEVPVFISFSQKSGLLGPNPSGLLGMTGLLLLAVILFIRLDKGENKLS